MQSTRSKKVLLSIGVLLSVVLGYILTIVGLEGKNSPLASTSTTGAGESAQCAMSSATEDADLRFVNCAGFF